MKQTREQKLEAAATKARDWFEKAPTEELEAVEKAMRENAPVVELSEALGRPMTGILPTLTPSQLRRLKITPGKTDWAWYAKSGAPMNQEDVKEFREWVTGVLRVLTPEQREQLGIRFR